MNKSESKQQALMLAAMAALDERQALAEGDIWMARDARRTRERINAEYNLAVKGPLDEEEADV